MRLSKFDSDDVHRAGNKHQAADAILRLNKTSQDKCPLENELPLYAIESHDNSRRLVNAIAEDVDHAQNVPDINLSHDNAEHAPPATVKKIQVWQQGTFHRTAAAQVGQRSCDFIVNEESLLIRKA